MKIPAAMLIASPRMNVGMIMGMIVGMSMGMSAAHAESWRFGVGVSYVTGIQDVADHYEDNLRRAGFDADVNLRLPVGFGAMATYLWKSDVRADFGLGPMFSISGDVHHFELPVSATVGYSFMSSSSVSPFVRAGLVYHYVDGDQYSGTSPGLIVAAGVDFTHFTVEVATDQSEVEFDALSCPASGACALTKEKLNTYDFIASFYYRF